MFTGLVETTAVLRQPKRAGVGARVAVSVRLGAIAVGESISVHGACLTVTEVTAQGFEADVSAETLSRTTLGTLGAGARVNVERACRLGDRLGGHIVTGHVDGVGRVASLQPVGDAVRMRVYAPAEVLRYVAEKGSIAIDGVSLTVNTLYTKGAAREQGFDVMLVPHTLAHTTLRLLAVGDGVNLEADVLSRYVARQLELGHLLPPPRKASRRQAAATVDPVRERLLLEKLRAGGFL